MAVRLLSPPNLFINVTDISSCQAALDGDYMSKYQELKLKSSYRYIISILASSRNTI
jgi:hypothetical protein